MTNFNDLLEKGQPSDRDNLPLNMLTIYQDSIVADDVNNNSKFSFELSVINSSHSTDLYEFAISLNYAIFTIFTNL